MGLIIILFAVDIFCGNQMNSHIYTLSDIVKVYFKEFTYFCLFQSLNCYTKKFGKTVVLHDSDGHWKKRLR